jgi:hypothetical protein
MSRKISKKRRKNGMSKRRIKSCGIFQAKDALHRERNESKSFEIGDAGDESKPALIKHS